LDALQPHDLASVSASARFLTKGLLPVRIALIKSRSPPLPSRCVHRSTFLFTMCCRVSEVSSSIWLIFAEALGHQLLKTTPAASANTSDETSLMAYSSSSSGSGSGSGWQQQQGCFLVTWQEEIMSSSRCCC
jgi:hypothetical protein